jgi:hypothetical protein
VELVDTLNLGFSGCKIVWVQIPSPVYYDEWPSGLRQWS